MQIIVRSKQPETDQRKRESAKAILKHYHEREIRDGSRFRSKAGTKEQIKRTYEIR